VFLLAGIGALLNVVTARLARIVDRARKLEAQVLADSGREELGRLRPELAVLDKRMVYAQRAIWLFTIAALLVCLVVACLFISELISLTVALPVALMFIAAMFAMVGGLSLFLMEISIATKTLRVRADLFLK
jgi:hypothetical protein